MKVLIFVMMRGCMHLLKIIKASSLSFPVSLMPFLELRKWAEEKHKRRSDMRYGELQWLFKGLRVLFVDKLHEYIIYSVVHGTLLRILFCLDPKVVECAI